VTESDIQSLGDEELANIVNSYGEFPYESKEWDIFKQAKTEAARRSDLSASQRAARGEQALPLDLA
jgi:hypothetical protein